MSSLNKTQLIGTITHVPEARAMPNNGGYVTNVRLVTYDSYKDKVTGELKEIAEFHRVALFGALAEAARDLKQGVEIYVEGRNRTRKYEVAQQTRYITEVNATAFWETGQRRTHQGNSAVTPAASGRPAPQGEPSAPVQPDSDDDQPPF